jgi:hypothetical protein
VKLLLLQVVQVVAEERAQVQMELSIGMEHFSLTALTSMDLQEQVSISRIHAQAAIKMAMEAEAVAAVAATTEVLVVQHRCALTSVLEQAALPEEIILLQEQH